MVLVSMLADEAVVVAPAGHGVSKDCVYCDKDKRQGCWSGGHAGHTACRDRDCLLLLNACDFDHR